MKPQAKPKSKFDVNSAFNTFYSEYPRHDSKQVALLKFHKIMSEQKTDEKKEELLSKMLSAVRIQKQSEQWQREGGKFIPMPSTWLNQQRWEDEGTLAPSEQSIFDPNGSVASSIISKMKV